MKHIIDVRSNALYRQPESEKEFKLEAVLEIIIIHTEGKQYNIKGGKIETRPHFVESRFTCSSDQLSQLIVDLQMHQKKMDCIKLNAEKLTSLVKYVTDEAKPEQ